MRASCGKTRDKCCFGLLHPRQWGRAKPTSYPAPGCELCRRRSVLTSGASRFCTKPSGRPRRSGASSKRTEHAAFASLSSLRFRVPFYGLRACAFRIAGTVGMLVSPMQGRSVAGRWHALCVCGQAGSACAAICSAAPPVHHHGELALVRAERWAIKVGGRTGCLACIADILS